MARARGELDFEREARNAERFAELNRDEPLVYVPRVFHEATTRRVLTMEHSVGHRLDDPKLPAPIRAQLAQTLMRLFLTQVFEHGLFHADPHPGNLFLLADGRICFHDFGAIGELSPAVQESLRQLFLAVMARDAGWAASAYLGMGGATAELDRAAFTRDLSAALDRYYRDSGAGRQSFGAIIHEFIGLGRRHHVRLLRETTMLMRAFAELESVARRMDPNSSSLAAFQVYSGRRNFALGMDCARRRARAPRTAGVVAGGSQGRGERDAARRDGPRARPLGGAGGAGRRRVVRRAAMACHRADGLGVVAHRCRGSSRRARALASRGALAAAPCEAIGIGLLVWGVVLLVGALAGAREPFQPLAPWRAVDSALTISRGFTG